MPARIVLTLPLPPAGLHPNARLHWAAKARLTKKTRSETALIARQVAPEKPWKRCLIIPEFYMPRQRDFDGLTAWLKAVIDGLQDGGIVENDSGVQVSGPIQHTGKIAGRKLVLTIIKEVWPCRFTAKPPPSACSSARR